MGCQVLFVVNSVRWECNVGVTRKQSAISRQPSAIRKFRRLRNSWRRRCVGSIATHPFVCAQGRLLQKTQGWGSHVSLGERKNRAGKGWASPGVKIPALCLQKTQTQGRGTLRAERGERVGQPPGQRERWMWPPLPVPTGAFPVIVRGVIAYSMSATVYPSFG